MSEENVLKDILNLGFDWDKETISGKIEESDEEKTDGSDEPPRTTTENTGINQGNKVNE